MSGSNERRMGERFCVDWQVDCETEDTFLFATITNVSAMGIFVRTQAPLPIGTPLVLKFAPLIVSTPTGDGLRHAGAADRFELEGTVQWINPDSPGCPNPGMGIRFGDLQVDDRNRLLQAIRSIAFLPAELHPVVDA